jgi:hypothetical protein
VTLPPGLHKTMLLTDADRQHLLARVHRLTQSQSNDKRTRKAWSVGEVLHHLLFIEVTISELCKTLIKEDQRVIGTSDVRRIEDMTYGVD